MTMTFKGLCIAGFAALLPTLASAAPWSRQYVVEWLEPDFYHGGQAGDQVGPGSDCPAGTNAAQDWAKVLKIKWRPDAEIPHYLDPEERWTLKKIIRFRGPNYENVWEEPWKAPDLGMQTVTGKIANGFDLDGNEKTGGFHSKDGSIKGIDNGYYLVGGCWASYRGHPQQTQRAVQTNNTMRDGLFTSVVVISGNQDPMNDEDATFAFYQAQETVIKDALSGVARDDTFTVKPTMRTQSIFKVRIKDGLVETQAPAEIRLRDEAWNRSQPDQLRLLQGQVRLQMLPDGALDGAIGGYRDWKVIYRKQAVTAAPPRCCRAWICPASTIRSSATRTMRPTRRPARRP